MFCDAENADLFSWQIFETTTGVDNNLPQFHLSHLYRSLVCTMTLAATEEISVVSQMNVTSLTVKQRKVAVKLLGSRKLGKMCGTFHQNTGMGFAALYIIVICPKLQ